MSQEFIDDIKEFFAKRSDEELQELAKWARENSPENDISAEDYMKVFGPLLLKSDVIKLLVWCAEETRKEERSHWKAIVEKQLDVWQKSCGSSEFKQTQDRLSAVMVFSKELLDLMEAEG
jgi:hypothetical protein